MKKIFYLSTALFSVISLCVSSAFATRDPEKASLIQRKVAKKVPEKAPPMDPDFSCYTTEHNVGHAIWYHLGREKESHIWLICFSALRSISLYFEFLPESLSQQHIVDFFRYWQNRFKKWDGLDNNAMNVLSCNLEWLENVNEKDLFLPPEALGYLVHARGKSNQSPFYSWTISLSLESENIDDADLCLFVGILQNNKRLTRLNLARNKIKQLGHLKMLINLETLVISNNELKSLHSLKNLVNLTYLDVSHNDITEIDDISELKYLVYLDFSHNKVEHTQVLVKLGELKTLIMTNNKITGNVEWIKNLPKLKTIRLDNNPYIDKESMKKAIDEKVKSTSKFSHDMTFP